MLHLVLRKLLTISLYIGICMGIVACEGGNESNETPVVTAESTSSVTAKNISANLSGVEIALRIPPGWNGRKMDNGILIAEQQGSIHNIGKLMGMQVYVFVHSIDKFPPSIRSDAHPARSILEQVVSEPEMVGNSAVSIPQAFTWDGNDAAYYLLNDTNQNVSLIVAVVLANRSQLVAINISCPSSQADSVRKALPDLLDDLWVNNILMSTAVIDALPDPLIFPVYLEKTVTANP